MSGVKLENIVKSYGKVEVVHGIDLEVGEKEFVVLVGPWVGRNHLRCYQH